MTPAVPGQIAENFHVLSPADYRISRWKNGLGETVEIARSPAGTGLYDFDWRVSFAAVAADGPFSQFPGVDRTIMVFEGKGMVLSLGTVTVAVQPLLPFAPFTFSGEMPVNGQLLDGPVRDLNLMCKRSAYFGTMRAAGSDLEWTETGHATTTLVFASTGPVELSVNSTLARLAALGTGLVTGAGQMALHGDAAASAVVMRICPA